MSLESYVKLEVPSGDTSGYLAVPDSTGPWPGVVVIQEWWGLDDHIRDITRRLAREGFITLAPDLYYGKSASEPDEARKLRMAQEIPVALEIIQSAVDFLLGDDRVSPKRIGLVGFCMGGGLAFQSAAKLNGVGATAPCYGGGEELTPEEVGNIRGPVLAIYGELDQGVSPEVARRRASLMDAAGIQHETIIYPGARHAFMNDTRAAYHPEAAADAWRKIVSFFRETLRE